MGERGISESGVIVNEEPGFEIAKGVVHPDPDFDLPQFALDLLEGRNALIEARQAVEIWARSQEAALGPAGQILNDIDEAAKIRLLEQLPDNELPSPVRDLIDAAHRFAIAQQASQHAVSAGGYMPKSDPPSPGDDVSGGLRSAYLRVLEGYAVWGGFRYYGWTNQKDPRNFYGPMIWSEQDCVLRLAIELEKEFPNSVHTEFKINRAMRADYSPDSDSRQAIDLVVSDLNGLEESTETQAAFRTWQHSLFIEAKWLKSGRWTKTGELLKRATDPKGGIAKDLRNLSRAVEIGRCKQAAMLVFDDECFLDYHGDLIDWPNNVEPLIVSPTQLKKHELGGSDLDEHLSRIDQLHRMSCACRNGSLNI